MKRAVLVACVGKKKKRAAPARDLYQSTWFKKARRYAELDGNEWYILSAKHGLLHPSEIVEPYDLTLRDYTFRRRTIWAAGGVCRLFDEIPLHWEIVVLAGRDYREPLIWFLSNIWPVTVPMMGMGIGKQLAWLNQQIEAYHGAREFTLETMDKVR